jgi:parallel beta-helix repeat protein
VVKTATVLLSVGLLLISFGASHARTWYVTEDGTGDAPTIQAAMDSSAFGDSVLVAAGTYSGQIAIADGVALVSEEGPLSTILSHEIPPVVSFTEGLWGALVGFTLTGVTTEDEYDGVVSKGGPGYFVIRANVIVGNASHGISCIYVENGEIVGNTIVDNGGMGIYVDWADGGLISNNICVGHYYGVWMHQAFVGIGCSNVWGNGFDVILPPAPPTRDWPWGSNMSEDPLFCDRDEGDLRLETCSPCLPGNHPGGNNCGLIGVLGEGCFSPSATVTESWGAVKALYR